MNLDWLETRAYISGNSLAVIDSINHRQWSYIELNQRAVTLAHYLQQHQIKKGDRVVVISCNHICHLDLFFACNKIGAIYVPLNWMFTAVELNNLIQDCQPKAIFKFSKSR